MSLGGDPVTLQISLSELGVEHGHLGGGVAEQLHERGKADAGAKHLGGVSMAEHVGRDDSINAQESPHLSKFATKFPQQGGAVMTACQEPPVWRRRTERPEKAQTMNDLANGVIDGNEALGVQLAEGHMNGPLFFGAHQ